MIHGLLLSLGQLFDRPIVRVLFKSLALALLLFVALGFGLWIAMDRLAGFANEWMGLGTAAGTLADVATLLLFVLGWWLLFRAVAVAVVGIFADEVVAAVEAKHYPEAHAAARDVPLGRSVAMGVGSALRAIGFNLLLSPLYLMLLITGVGTALAFFVVNAWLLGRDLGDMVAARHIPYAQLAEWRHGTRLRRFALGAVSTGLFLVPLVNLVTPVLGAALATHMFHRGRVA
ncbi:EI24 domain-containing protein [Sphingomonas psychrotolerans]|uniref:EI24 domain-containing protein n=1 Tax=Sphingomonas psychrotolerans TaxID=1327635 RepID=A0ABU3N7L8_9SPHN|nr:EI24 domain-containing protein [Sphingomonas psychrotolerans]MDT8759864.1 EI24 domain-containing protein [Sphingomonas psychrotolerans]